MREAFGRRLQQKMVERGWNQSELARAAAEHMPGGRFGRDNVSTYIRGTTLPSQAVDWSTAMKIIQLLKGQEPGQGS